MPVSGSVWLLASTADREDPREKPPRSSGGKYPGVQHWTLHRETDSSLRVPGNLRSYTGGAGLYLSLFRGTADIGILARIEIALVEVSGLALPQAANRKAADAG